MYSCVICVHGSGIGVCFFFNFLWLRMMSARYLMKICEKVSMSLWILLVRILRSNKFLMMVLCIVHVIHVIMINWGKAIHPCWG